MSSALFVESTKEIETAKNLAANKTNTTSVNVPLTIKVGQPVVTQPTPVLKPTDYDKEIEEKNTLVQAYSDQVNALRTAKIINQHTNNVAARNAADAARNATNDSRNATNVSITYTTDTPSAPAIITPDQCNTKTRDDFVHGDFVHGDFRRDDFVHGDFVQDDFRHGDFRRDNFRQDNLRQDNLRQDNLRQDNLRYESSPISKNLFRRDATSGQNSNQNNESDFVKYNDKVYQSLCIYGNKCNSLKDNESFHCNKVHLNEKICLHAIKHSCNRLSCKFIHPEIFDRKNHTAKVDNKLIYIPGSYIEHLEKNKTKNSPSRENNSVKREDNFIRGNNYDNYSDNYSDNYLSSEEVKYVVRPTVSEPLFDMYGQPVQERQYQPVQERQYQPVQERQYQPLLSPISLRVNQQRQTEQRQTEQRQPQQRQTQQRQTPPHHYYASTASDNTPTSSGSTPTKQIYDKEPKLNHKRTEANHTSTHRTDSLLAKLNINIEDLSITERLKLATEINKIVESDLSAESDLSDRADKVNLSNRADRTRSKSRGRSQRSKSRVRFVDNPEEDDIERVNINEQDDHQQDDHAQQHNTYVRGGRGRGRGGRGRGSVRGLHGRSTMV